VYLGCEPRTRRVQLRLWVVPKTYSPVYGLVGIVYKTLHFCAVDQLQLGFLVARGEYEQVRLVLGSRGRVQEVLAMSTTGTRVVLLGSCSFRLAFWLLLGFY
jgi:hypothetical protein